MLKINNIVCINYDLMSIIIQIFYSSNDVHDHRRPRIMFLVYSFLNFPRHTILFGLSKPVKTKTQSSFLKMNHVTCEIM